MNIDPLKAKEMLPHIMAIIRAGKDDPKFRKEFIDGFFSEKGFKDFEKMLEVYALVSLFINEHRISCSEATAEDRVYENAPEFVESLANVVGYFKYEDEE